MRILIASENFPPDIGGPALHSERLAHYLYELKHTVTVITFGTPTHSYPFPIINIPFTLPKLIRILRYIFNIFIISKKNDLVYAQGTGSSGIVARYTSLITRTPYIIRSGGDVLWERWALNQTNFNILPLDAFYSRKKYKGIRYFFIKSTLKNAQDIVVPTHILKEIYTRYYDVPLDRITIIPNPFPQYCDFSINSKNTSYSSSEVEKLPSHSSDSHRITFMGRLVNYKNIAALIHAFNETLTRHPNWQLHIVGNGPERKTLIDIVQSLEKENSILFHDQLSHEKALSFIEQSDIVVSPSITDFNPNAILEALALCKPVLISQENGLSIKLHDQFLINPLDRSDITAKLNNLIENYTSAQQKINTLDLSWSWDDVLSAHSVIINTLNEHHQHQSR